MQKNFSYILLIFFIFILFSPIFGFSRDSSDERRVEEGKRKALETTEQNSSAKGTKKGYRSPPPMDPLDRMYFAELILKKITYQYDLCKVISLLLEKEKTYITLDAQIRLLKENKFLPKSLETNFNPTEPLRKGVAAYIFCKTLEIKGGLAIRLFGLTEHTAINELVYEGIMPAGNAKEIVTGEELISVFTQAVSYRKDHAK